MLEIVDALKAVKAGCSDPTVLGSFSESHDLDRFPTITDDLAVCFLTDYFFRGQFD